MLGSLMWRREFPVAVDYYEMFMVKEIRGLLSGVRRRQRLLNGLRWLRARGAARIDSSVWRLSCCGYSENHSALKR